MTLGGSINGLMLWPRSRRPRYYLKYTLLTKNGHHIAKGKVGRLLNPNSPVVHLEAIQILHSHSNKRSTDITHPRPYSGSNQLFARAQCNHLDTSMNAWAMVNLMRCFSISGVPWIVWLVTLRCNFIYEALGINYKCGWRYWWCRQHAKLLQSAGWRWPSVRCGNEDVKIVP